MRYKVLFGFLGIFFFYGFLHGLHLKNMQASIDSSQSKLARLQLKVDALREKNARAKHLIESKDDPATLELILMENLGLVPSGAKKIYFK